MFLPTFLMGTTFPLLCHAFRDRSVFPSELYGWNTLGACTGVLASEFWLLVHLGHTAAFAVLSGANVLLGLAFLALARRHRAGVPGGEDAPSDVGRAERRRRARRAGRSAAPTPAARPAPAFHPTTTLAAAGLSGFVAGALEVDMFRAVRFAGAITDAAMSFTSFWAIVAIVAASWTVRALGRPRPVLIQASVIGALLAHAVTWTQLPAIRGWFNQRYMDWVANRVHLDPSVADATIYPLSASLPLLLGFTGVVVFPAFYCISLLLPTVCNVVQGSRSHLGRAYGLNTLAFCAGAFLFTWALPLVSLFYAVKLLFVVVAVAALLALTLRPGRPVRALPLGGALLASVAGALLVPAGFDRGFFPDHELPARYPVRAMKSNGVHTTYVVEDPAGDVLFFDSHPMSGTSLLGQRYMRMMAHVPLLAQEAPERALLICFGVGNTAHAIAAHETVQQLDVVDLNDRVFETADEFARTNGRVHADPRVRLIHDDGRVFLERSHATYDLVTSEPPPPRAAGVYRLYSVEYYRSVLDHLTPTGMMTQWLPVNILSREATVRMVKSFVEVFPHALLYVGGGDQLILLGGRRPFDAARVERRFGASERVQRDLLAIGLDDPLAVLARVVRVGEDLRADVDGVRVISDERNDLTLTVTDPFDPPVLALDPRAVLRALEPDRLECGERLTATLTDPRRLLEAVPDFPATLGAGAP